MVATQPDASVRQAFAAYLRVHKRQELLGLLRNPQQEGHYGIRLSLAALAAAEPELAEAALSAPAGVLPYVDAALVDAQEQLLAELADAAACSVKESAHARLGGLAYFRDPAARDVSPAAGELAAAHIGRLLTLSGTVARTGVVKMLEARRLFECPRCEHRFVVSADMEMGGVVQLPAICPSGRDRPCKATTFRHCEEVALYTNFQEVKLQQAAHGGGLGAPGKSVTVLLQDELADSCQVGDEVEVTGVVMRRFGPMLPGVRCQLALAVQATDLVRANERKGAVEVTPEAEAAFRQFWAAHAACPLVGRNKLVASVCPELHGLFTVKLASLLMLCGGVARQEEGGSHIRGEVHMLLVGDPGTGKSQFQKNVAKLASRAVLTSGRCTTAAGLTAAAVREGPHWSLEAGALVLADGGVCLIDEFDGIREADRAAIHEAMEQQTTSVAKAGMVATLHTRAAVFGCCNPRGNQRYNPRLPLSAQLNISGPLLSRFDIVLLLLDELNPVWDETVADHVLATHQRKARPGSGGSGGGMTQPPAAQQQQQQLGEAWPIDMLQQYLACVRQHFEPRLSPQAEGLLMRYYQLRRQMEGRQAARTTVRMLESLVRVAQAHARLLAQEQVTLRDAVVAIAVMESSAVDAASAALPELCVSARHSQFPTDPDQDYAELERIVLGALGPETSGGACMQQQACLPWGGGMGSAQAAAGGGGGAELWPAGPGWEGGGGWDGT